MRNISEFGKDARDRGVIELFGSVSICFLSLEIITEFIIHKKRTHCACKTYTFA